MDKTRITVAKALKLKNRLAGRVSKLQHEISTYNSIPERQERPDVTQLMDLLGRTVENLSTLKYTLYLANGKVQKIIFDLAEHKSRLEWLSGLSTRNGQFKEYGDDEPVLYVAVVRKTDVDTQTAKLEQEIDVLQEALDKFNHTTEIEVPAEMLEPLSVVATKSM